MNDKIVIKPTEEIKDLIPGFIEHRFKDIKEMREALKVSGFVAIQSLGHKMKGCGGGYGFDGLTVIGGAIEQAAKNNDATEIEKKIADFESYMNRLEIVYE